MSKLKDWFGGFGRNTQDEAKVIPLESVSQEKRLPVPYIEFNTGHDHSLHEAMGYRSVEERDVNYGILLAGGYDPENESLLDLGCGYGDIYDYIVSFYGKTPKRYVGVEMSDPVFTSLQEKFSHENYVEQSDSITVVQAEQMMYLQSVLGKEPEEFDRVILCHSLNYTLDGTEKSQMDYLEQLLVHAWRYARKGIFMNLSCFPNALNTTVDADGYVWSWDKAKVITDILDKLFRGKWIVRCDYLGSMEMTVYIYKHRD